MARDWVEVVLNLESYYKRATGGTSRDEDLRRSIVRYTNDVLKEVERIRRWPFAYGIASFLTTPGLATYGIPSGILVISSVFRLDASGHPTTLELYTAKELRRTYNQEPNATNAAPLTYAILGNDIVLYPAPDNTGPVATNYEIFVEGYQTLTPIVETSGTTVAASNVLTVPSTAHLTARGVPNSGTTGLSVRGAGNLGVGSTADTHVTSWTAFPTATTVTMGANAITAIAALGAQVFFNSQNWLITDFPKVIEFAVLRELSAYLKDDYRMWEARYQHELDLMAEHASDRQTSLEQMLTATLGQRVPQLRRLDNLLGVEVRGGVL